MGGHNVVIAVMPEIGNNSAAIVATQLLNDFTSIRFGLLVGIGGGITSDDEDDIWLGDVVVSKPTATFGGVGVALEVCNIVTKLRINPMEEQGNRMHIELMEILLDGTTNTNSDCHCSW